jgi:hypothetical protein
MTNLKAFKAEFPFLTDAEELNDSQRAFLLDCKDAVRDEYANTRHKSDYSRPDTAMKMLGNIEDHLSEYALQMADDRAYDHWGAYDRR